MGPKNRKNKAEIKGYLIWLNLGQIMGSDGLTQQVYMGYYEGFTAGSKRGFLNRLGNSRGLNRGCKQGTKRVVITGLLGD